MRRSRWNTGGVDLCEYDFWAEYAGDDDTGGSGDCVDCERGDYYTPTVVAGKMVDGNSVKNEEPKPVRRTVSKQTSETMREMLYGTRRAWRSNGTDKEGYYVGGKTGTAQVIKMGNIRLMRPGRHMLEWAERRGIAGICDYGASLGRE